MRFVVAEKYGCAPGAIFDWSDYDYNRALFYLVAETGANKMTADDVEERRKERMAENPTGELLGVSLNHFAQFIDDGELNVAKLITEGGYAKHQVDYIREELGKAGMLHTVKATAPLAFQDED